MLSDYAKRIRIFGIDLRSRSQRRWLVIIVYTVFLGVFFAATQKEFLYVDGGLCVLGYLALALPLRQSFGRAVPAGGTLSGDRILFKLDDWSRYRYGGALSEISAMERDELLRFYNPDKYVSIHKSAFNIELSQQDTADRDRASHRALNIISYLLLAAGIILDRWKIQANLVIAALLFAVVTMPNAIILWSTLDPRNLTREVTMSEPEIE